MSGDLALASKDLGLRVLTVYGGVAYEPQLDALKTGVDVVVGTPGRLIDLINRKALDVSHVHALVLDEADEMLDLGFLPDVEKLLSKTPETRQTMLFSATMPAAIVALARTHMRHPMNIRAESSYDTQLVPATAQFIFQAHDLDKPEIIARILQAEDAEKIIVFTRTKRQAQRVADDLAERGFAASPLHGDMAQIARERALTKFRENKMRVLVATDVAARGIDVQGVSHVINYTCPEDEKTYIHRIGRTGRAGASGIAVTFVDWADLHRWKMINKALDLPFDEPQETYSTSRAPLPRPRDRPRAPRGASCRPSRSSETTRIAIGSLASERPAAATGSGPARAAARRSRRTPRPPPRPARRSGDATERPAGQSRNRRRRRRGRPAPAPAPAKPPPNHRVGAKQTPKSRRVVMCRLGEHRRAPAERGMAQADAGTAQSAQAVTTTFVPIGAKSHSAMASGRSCRMHPCDRGVPSWALVCSGWSWLVGIEWKPIAAPVGPWVKRTKYCMTPESSTPTAQRDFE